MNVIEAAKAAGWPQTAIDMASKEEIERMERFAQIIRNQALEDAAKCCDKEKDAWADYSDGHIAFKEIAHAIRSMKKEQQ